MNSFYINLYITTCINHSRRRGWKHICGHSCTQRKPTRLIWRPPYQMCYQYKRQTSVPNLKWIKYRFVMNSRTRLNQLGRTINMKDGTKSSIPVGWMHICPISQFLWSCKVTIDGSNFGGIGTTNALYTLATIDVCTWEYKQTRATSKLYRQTSSRLCWKQRGTGSPSCCVLC